MRKIIGAVAAMVMTMACSRIPSGYTPEAWERLERANINQARAIQWIEADPTRQRIRQIYLKEWKGDVRLADHILAGCAEPEFVGGQPGAFKEILRRTTIQQINNGVTWAQSKETLDRKYETLKALDAL